MELRLARLCLDCEEVHDETQCPVCGSESFSYLSRWVPAATSRPRPRAATSPEADVYKQLIGSEPPPSRTRRMLKRGVLGLTAIGLAGVLFGSREAGKSGKP